MKYADIIDLPHHISKTRPRMSRTERAAQFSPFAALTGHDLAIKETARLTDDKMHLDTSAKEELGQRLQRLAENNNAEVSLTWFCPDTKKSGGSYQVSTGKVRKVDLHERMLILLSGEKIPLDNIVAIEGTIFSSL